MSSKNDDISARSPQGRYDLPGGSYEIIETDVSGSLDRNATGRRVITTYRPAYLSEDETVLACCHHAHEVAKANGAREVMLEHLLHALVRVPESAQVLQDRGINVESLKRESTAVISSEIPVDHTMMVAQLRASKDFNTVMHLAAAAASRRDERQLGARDLLDALLRFDPKSRVVRMIRRHAIEGEMDEPVDPLTEVKAVIERYAGEQRDLRLAVNELRNAQSGQTSAAVSGLEDRLRGMERSLNLLLSEAASERAAFTDRLKGFHDTLSAHRNDTRAVADRMQGMERLAAAGGGANGGQLQSLIGDRFLSVQKSIEMHRTDIGRIEQVVTERMRSVDGLTARLGQLETELQTRTTDTGKLESILIDRLKAFEQVASGKGLTLPPGLDTLSDRMQGLERQVSAQRAEMQSWQGALEKDVKAIEEMFDLVPTGDGAQRPAIADQQVQALQHSIDTHRAETQDRHRSFERMLDAKLSGMGALTGVADRLVSVERALTAQRSDQAGVRGTLDSELEQIRKAMLSLGNAQQTLSTAIDEWRQNNSGDLSIISNRLAVLERQATTAQASMDRSAMDRTAIERAAYTEPAVIGRNGTPSLAAAVPAQAAQQPAAVPVTPAAAPIHQQPSGLLDRVDRVLGNRYNSN